MGAKVVECSDLCLGNGATGMGECVVDRRGRAEEPMGNAKMRWTGCRSESAWRVGGRLKVM